MNDLMTKSFLSYVELKKQAQMDLEANIQNEAASELSAKDEQNLSLFFKEIEAIKAVMEEISNLLFDLQRLNEEAKSTHSAKVLRGLRDQMDSNMIAVLRKAKVIKARLETLDQSNVRNRRIPEFCAGSPVDRTRMAITNGVRIKLKDMMIDFQSLRDKILSDYKEDLRRKYYNSTGEEPSEEVIEKMILGGGSVQILEGNNAKEMEMETRERHEAITDIKKSLDKLHQVFLDMAVLVETQGEKVDDIEENVANAGTYISGGTNNLYYANQMKKNKKWVYWVFAVIVIILLVCIISTLTS